MGGSEWSRRDIDPLRQAPRKTLPPSVAAVAWSVKEDAAQPEAHWRLVQLATWAVLSGKVPDPYSEEMHVENAHNRSLPPTALATILELDDSIFHPQEYIKKTTPVLSLAAGHSKKND